MRYHLFLNSIRNMVKTTKVFSRKLAVNFQSSTTVIFLKKSLSVNLSRPIPPLKSLKRKILQNLSRHLVWLGDTRAHTQVPPCSCSSMGLPRGLRWPLFLGFFTKRAPLSWAATWGWLGEDLGLLVATLRWGMGELCLHLHPFQFLSFLSLKN